MLSLVIHRDQGQARHVKAAAFRCGMGRGAPAADHHKVPPARSSLARNCGPAVRIRLGRFFDNPGDVLAFEALNRAGLSAAVALANLSQSAAHLAVQANAELPPVFHVASLSQKPEPMPGALDGCQHGMPKNWESLPKRRGE